MIFDVNAIESVIGYQFNDKMLLRKAFTHSSYAYEHNQEDNEVMEFFGDAIIQMVVTEWLYKNVHGDEGLLTRFRAEMVARTPLNQALHELGLDEHILLGNGQQKSACRDEKFFSSVYEALVCAIYLDGGMAPVKKFVISTVVDNFKEDKKRTQSHREHASSKSQFQEYVQQNKLGKIEYRLVSKKGPDHAAEFCVELLLNDVVKARGKGFSKKSAEAKAAQSALRKLKANKDGKKN